MKYVTKLQAARLVWFVTGLACGWILWGGVL